MTSSRPKPSRAPAAFLGRLRENAAYSWLSDAWEALQETADESLIAARRSARKSNEEQWRRYETKVGHRRGDQRKTRIIEGEALPAKPALPASPIEELDAAEAAIPEHATIGGEPEDE